MEMDEKILISKRIIWRSKIIFIYQIESKKM